MRTTTPGRPILSSFDLRWKGLGWRRVGLGLLGVLVAFGSGGLYRWWSSWPVRVVLPAPSLSCSPTFSLDSRVLATTGPDGVNFWDVSDGRKRAAWPLPEATQSVPSGYGFSSNGRVFVTALHPPDPSEAPTMHLIEVSSGSTLATIPDIEGEGARLEDYTFSADGRDLLLVVRHDNSIEIVECDVTTGSVSRRTSIAAGNRTIEYLGPVFSADGGKLRLVVGYKDVPGEVLNYDVAGARVLSRHPFSVRWSWIASRLVLSPDARFLAVADFVAANPPPRRYSTDVLIWDLDQDRYVGRLPGHLGGPGITSLHPSADWTVLGLGREDGSIEVWDFREKRLRATYRGHTPGFVSQWLVLAPDGSTLASVGALSKPALTTTSLTWRLRDAAGRRLWMAAVRSKRLVRDPPFETIVLDIRSGGSRWQFESEGLPLFSPDGHTLATWDESSVFLRAIPSHSTAITAGPVRRQRHENEP